MGADSHWSSALPCGTPSITSTRTMVRARDFSARRWAAVAPTLPAPTTVILFTMPGRSPAPGVHLAVGIGPERIEPVQRAPVTHAEPLLGPAVRTLLPRVANQRRELRVAGAAAQRLPQVDAPPRVQTQEPRPVRRDAAAITIPAERRRRGCDDAERGAVLESEPLRRGPAVARKGLDRPVVALQRVEH